MKTIVGEEHNRIWSVDDIPGYKGPLQIEVRYKDPGGCTEGIALDHHIVPLFKAAPRMLEVLKDVLRRISDSDEWWMDCPERGGFDKEAIEAAIAGAAKEDA